jgi:hypothetical protein
MIETTSPGEFIAAYTLMNDEELLNIAAARADLSESARWALDAEMARRGFTFQQAEENAAEVERAEGQRTVDSIGAFHLYGIGKRLWGQAHRVRDEKAATVEYDATLWITLFWFPVFPHCTLRVRKSLHGGSKLEFVANRPRNWLQIGLTWLCALSVVLIIRVVLH